MKRLIILLLTICSFASFGQILQDPNTTPSTARSNDAISGAYTASGTDTYTISPVGSFSYTWLTGKAVSITFPPAQVNTGSATLNFDGLGAKNIQKYSSGALTDVVAGDLIGTVRLRYDGTQFVMEGGTGGGGSVPTLQEVLDAGSTATTTTSVGIIADTNDQFDVSTPPALGAYGSLNLYSTGSTNARLTLNGATTTGAFSLSSGRSTTYGDGMRFYDNRSSKVGIQYSASGYVTDNRSLTDKQYADEHLAGLTFTNSPSTNYVPQFNGTNITWAAAGGGSGDVTYADLKTSRTLTSADDLDQSDQFKIVYVESPTPFDVTVDALDVGTQIYVANDGAAPVTLIAGSGVTLTSTDIEGGKTAVITYKTSTAPSVSVSGGSGTVDTGTINEIAAYTGTTTVGSLTTATYPSLTELSYVKGVTSAIQTQLDTKASTYTVASTAFVDANGNDGTAIIGRADKPFATIDAALDAGVAVTSLKIKVSMGTYAKPTFAKINRSNLWIEGSGKPGYNWSVSQTAYGTTTITNPTSLLGGTIINGGLVFADVSNVMISNLGVDNGSAYIAGGGTESNCISFGSLTTTYPFPLLKNIIVKDVTVLGNTASSLFHGIIIENGFDPFISNADVYFQTHGIVTKSNGGTIDNVRVYKNSGSGIFIRSNDYANSYATNLTNFEIRDGAGVLLESNTSAFNSAISISNGKIISCTFGIDVSANALAQQFLSVSNVLVRSTSGIAFDFAGCEYLKVNNCAVWASAGIGFRLIASATARLLSISNCRTLSSSVGFDLSGGGTNGYIYANDLIADFSTTYGYVLGSQIVSDNLHGTGNTSGLVSGSAPIANRYGLTAFSLSGASIVTPTAMVHLGAGTTAASSAPLKFTSGSLNTTAEAGAVEFLTDKFYGTITTGAARKEFTLNDAALTSGRVPYVTTNGRIKDESGYEYNESTNTETVGTVAATTAITTPTITTTAAVGSPTNTEAVSGSTTYKHYGMWWMNTTGSSATQDRDILSGYTDATATIIFTVTGTKSDGSESVGAQYAATYNKDGGTTVVQVGSTSNIYNHETDAASSVTISAATNLVSVSVNSGDADSYRWVVYADITITQL